mgnify:CR=1 FL=1
MILIKYYLLKQEILFEPSEVVIHASDTDIDSLFFHASRQKRKTIIVSGQSNAEHCGHPQFYISPDSVDLMMPYYLAYSGGEYGLSTLGLLTRFGKRFSFCKEYNKGFGFEMLLGRTLYKNYSDSLAVMKISYSGTALYDNWQEGGGTWQWFNEKHANAETRFRSKGLEPEYVGIFWFQGESDESNEAAPLYANNLYTFVDRMRAKFTNSSNLPELPFICVQISWNPSSPHEPTIRAAQMDISNHRSYTSCIDIDDCLDLRYSNTNMHFNGDALNRVGYRLAAEYLNMIDDPIDSNITISVDLDEVLDTTVILFCEGDTNFSQIIDGQTFDFNAKLGDSLTLSLNLGSDTYNYRPATREILFAYDQSALKDKTYTFNVNKEEVAIVEYPEEIDHVLMNAYPNPFNPLINISFTVPEYSKLRLNIYDLNGKCVASLLNKEFEGGSYELKWDASDLSSGVYIAKMLVGSEVITNKLILMK